MQLNPTTLTEAAEALTPEQVTQYAATTDKVCWIIDHVLDPLCFTNSESNINFVEDYLAQFA